jgi:hypothetical protein
MTGTMREIKILESVMLGTTDYDFKSIIIINKEVPSLRSSQILWKNLCGKNTLISDRLYICKKEYNNLEAERKITKFKNCKKTQWFVKN